MSSAWWGALLSFSSSTGLGWDKMHPRAWLRLGDAALRSLLHLFVLVESCGKWPEAIGHVLVVLLAKASGGFRPIGLFPSVVRVWMRIRLADAVVWQSVRERPWLYASSGKGADVAAWKQAARSEQAAARGWVYAAVLLDLVKAFERVPHDVLVRQAYALGYNLRLLRLSLAGYRLPRALMVEGACSRLVVATRGITAGAGHAVVELRVLLSDLWDRVHSLHPSIGLTVYVDDAGAEARGTEKHVLHALPAATQTIADGLRALRMELSSTKCAALASSVSLAARVAEACRPTVQLRAVRKTCSLGVGLAGGRAPASHALRQRLRKFRDRLMRFAAARRLAVNTARLLRSGATAGFTYGEASVGVAPALLQAQRVAAAKALGDRTAGGDLDLTLAVADGARGGMADPVFQAHLAPIVAWAQAAWETWMPRADMLHMASWAVGRSVSARRPWAVVCGPATATVASLARLGWRFRDGLTMVTQMGVELVLTQDPPARVAALVKEAAWQWRWGRVERCVPQLRPPPGQPSLGPCWRPLARLLDPSVKVPGWSGELRGALRSAVTNRQWPQARKHRAGLVQDAACRLCMAPVGSLGHRSVECVCHQDLRRAHAPHDVLACCGDSASIGDNLHWVTRALQATCAYIVPPPKQDATFMWVTRPEEGLLQPCWTVYTDGSMLDGPTPLLRRTGWAFVALDEVGRVQASACGVPPAWISTIFGAETWAVLQAVSHAMGDAILRIDCKAAADVLLQGR